MKKTSWTDELRTVTLRDPAGGGYAINGAVMTVHAKELRPIGSVTCTPILLPCRLFVTPGALGYLGDEGTIGMFNNHLSGAWLTINAEERQENSDIAKRNIEGTGIYDFSTRVAIVTYIGLESTLLLREEY